MGKKGGTSPNLDSLEIWGAASRVSIHLINLWNIFPRPLLNSEANKAIDAVQEP